MSRRDPEADRFELRAQRERDEALGQALFEHRRPNAPKAWEELSEADRTEWILIAVDQARGGAGSEVLLELESRLGPNPLSPDDPPNVHTPEPVEPVDTEQDEYDVAVVVFCRARGADEDDAESGAQLAVRHALAGNKQVRALPMLIPLPSHLVARGFTEPVQVADVSGLRYVGGQGIRLKATAEPYQNAGMGRPRKKDQ